MVGLPIVTVTGTPVDESSVKPVPELTPVTVIKLPTTDAEISALASKSTWNSDAIWAGVFIWLVSYLISSPFK